MWMRLLRQSFFASNWRQFYWRWFKGLFHRPSWTDAAGTVLGTAFGVAIHFWPNSVLAQQLWQAPIWGFGLIGVMRFMTAPFEIWREQGVQLQALRIARASSANKRAADFEDAIMELRYIVSAKEMWWRDNHQREGESVMRIRLYAATDALRLFFPPEIESGCDEDPISALHLATSELGMLVGYNRKGKVIEVARRDFETQLAGTIARFRAQNDPGISDGYQ
jgi:hypothetical protein